jgi:hypothetical protein
MGKKRYGLQPAMAIDVASSYLLSKARLSLAEREIEKMQNMGKPSTLVEQMVDLLMRGDGGSWRKLAFHYTFR